MRRKPHFLHTVVHLMESPKKWESMQKNMGKPLHKIQQDKKDQQLGPNRPGREIQDRQTFGSDSNMAKKNFEYFVYSTDNNGKNEKVEEHVETIQPKILSKNRLFLPPWK